jgi:hypothetical protein
VTVPDARAVKILLDTYWTSEGWRPEPRVPPADRDYAVQAGVMIRDNISATHDEVITGVLDARTGVSGEDAAGWFLASLTSRRLDLRSALSSFVIARRLEPHGFQQGPGHLLPGACAICGLRERDEEIDWSIMNFERFKWGGIRRDDLTYVWLDMQQLAAADRPTPTAADRAAFEHLLDGLDGAAPTVTATRAAGQRWPGIPSNKAEREVLLDILGICSVLETSEHSGFLRRFVPAADRVVPQHKFAERPYPVCWWRAEHGVNRSAAGELGLL